MRTGRHWEVVSSGACAPPSQAQARAQGLKSREGLVSLCPGGTGEVAGPGAEWMAVWHVQKDKGCSSQQDRDCLSSKRGTREAGDAPDASANR